MTHSLYERHRETLERALAACHSREYWSAYAEMPSGRLYGEDTAEQARAAFSAQLGQPFALAQAGSVDWVGEERSPYGFALDIRYPRADLDVLLPAMQAAMPAWRRAGADTRAGVCLEILARLNRASFEIAEAVMHTTGQAFMMAFQAGGPHAQDRGLEAVAYAWQAMHEQADSAHWVKPQGKAEPLQLDKTFTVMPRGVALVIGCCTFPTWNGYPGLFASLVTGNAVLVKPHAGAVLPLAITVRICREVLAEAGFDPELVALAVGTPGATLALRPEVRIIDFTGSSANGEWLEHNARQAQVFTEKAGVNSVVIDATDDFRGLVRNLSFSLALYSGQMCTAPQNFYIPRDGIDTEDGHKSFDEVAQALAGGVQKLLSDPARAVEVLGAIQNRGVLERLEAAQQLGTVVLASQAIEHPRYADACVRTPLLLKLDAARDEAVFSHEHFGPIAFCIATDDTAHSIALAKRLIQSHGALTAAVYARDAAVLEAMREAMLEAGVALSENLTGGVFVNQSAAFSDFHGTGANPAANAALSDSAFVASRFRVVQSRRPA